MTDLTTGYVVLKMPHTVQDPAELERILAENGMEPLELLAEVEALTLAVLDRLSEPGSATCAGAAPPGSKAPLVSKMLIKGGTAKWLAYVPNRGLLAAVHVLLGAGEGVPLHAVDKGADFDRLLQARRSASAAGTCEHVLIWSPRSAAETAHPSIEALALNTAVQLIHTPSQLDGTPGSLELRSLAVLALIGVKRARSEAQKALQETGRQRTDTCAVLMALTATLGTLAAAGNLAAAFEAVDPGINVVTSSGEPWYKEGMWRLPLGSQGKFVVWLPALLGRTLLMLFGGGQRWHQAQSTIGNITLGRADLEDKEENPAAEQQ